MSATTGLRDRERAGLAGLVARATRTTRAAERRRGGTSRVDLGVVLRPFGSLVGAQLIGTGLGFLFWIVAARGVPATTVGLVSAGVAVQALLGKVSLLGVGTHLISELPPLDEGRRRSLLRAATAVVAGAGLLVAGLFVLVVELTPGLTGTTVHALFASPVATTVFVVGTAATAVGLMLDQAVLGAQRSSLQVLRNLVASGLRFPLGVALLLVGLTGSGALLLCWALPLAVSAVLVWRRLFPRDGARGAHLEDPHGHGVLAQTARHARGSLRNHALDLSLSAGPLLVPVVAAAVLAPEANARFAIAWLVATFVFVPPYMLATALFAASVHEPVDDFCRRARRTLPGGLAISALLGAGAALTAPYLLRVFGAGYAEESATLLALLVPAGLWMVVKDHVVALWRVQRRVPAAAGLAAGGTLLEVAGTALGAVVAGAPGLCVGWLLALAVQAYGAAPVVDGILRAPLRSPDPGPHDDPRTAPSTTGRPDRPEEA